MKKFKNILSAFLSLTMIFATISAFPAEVFAASKPSSTKISSITVQCGETKVVIQKISGKFTDTCMDSYQIQYSEDKSFKTGVNTIITDSCTETAIYLEEMIAPFDTVYFRVRTQRETYKQKTAKVSWSKKPQKIWITDSITYSAWSDIYTYTAPNYSIDDDGAYDAHVQAQRVIAECSITSDMSDLEKIARVQKWINSNWYYYNDGGHGSSTPWSYLFYEKKGVCADFSLSFVPIMKELNIPCKELGCGVVYGAETNHSWNLIKINGYWWHYDCEADGIGNGGNISNFKRDTMLKGIDPGAKQIYQKCQPHGSEISPDSVDALNKTFNAMVASL